MSENINDNKKENKKIIHLEKRHILIMIIAILAIFAVGTFAWLSWKSRETGLVLTVGDVNNAQVILKPYQIDAEITPVLSYEGEEYVSVEATNNSTMSKLVKLFYRISDINDELKSANFKYTITKSVDNGSTYTEYLSGNFSTASANSDFYIMEEKLPANMTYKYKVYLWLEGSSDSQGNVQGKAFKGELRAEISSLPAITVDQLISKSNPSTLTYADATDSQKGEMWTFSHEATEQTVALTDYRYIGGSPNNYINFNDELWRIIGVFDGKIKIIKDIPIGNISWDYKLTGVGSSTTGSGSNDWTDAQLMYMLNPTTYKLKDDYSLDKNYIKDASGNIIYQLGCNPAKTAVGATSYNCTNNTWSLNDTALSQLSETTYYLGGESAYEELGADNYYNFERGKTVYSGRPTNWTGYVGLMYPSDYAYTFANGVDDTCYADTYDCNNGTPSSSWLSNSTSQWMMSPFSGNTFRSFSIYYDSVSGGYNTHNVFSVRPVVYLRSDIQLSGSGTQSNPYIIIN